VVPRAEVARIVAGLDVATQRTRGKVFSLAVFLSVVTTPMVPPLLVWSFHGGSGVRGTTSDGKEPLEIAIQLRNQEWAEFLLQRIAQALRSEKFFVTPVAEDHPVFQVRKDNIVFTIRLEHQRVVISVLPAHAGIARQLLSVVLKGLDSILESVRMARSAPELWTLSAADA